MSTDETDSTPLEPNPNHTWISRFGMLGYLLFIERIAANLRRTHKPRPRAPRDRKDQKAHRKHALDRLVAEEMEEARGRISVPQGGRVF